MPVVIFDFYLLFIYYFFKSLSNLLQYCFHMVFWFWSRGMWNLVPRPGIKPTSPASEGEVLTAVLPGKSLTFTFYKEHSSFCVENGL